MKKLILVGILFLFTPKVFSQTKSNYEDGYATGYQSVMKKWPVNIPENKSFTNQFQSVKNNQWEASIQNKKETADSSSNDNNQPNSISHRGDYESKMELNAYNVGFQQGNIDGQSDLKKKSAIAQE